jgi:hypothetical protein
LACDGVAEGLRQTSSCEPPRCGHPRFLIVKEAGMFLWLETVGEGLRVAEISEADLGALLRGSRARVRDVVHPFAEEGVGKGPATVSREECPGAPSGERGCREKEPAHEFAPRISAGKEGDFW